MATPNFKPGGSVVPSSQVEISVCARNLRDRDTFSKSDPMGVLFMKSLGSNNYLEIGRTEMVKDTLNPDFVHKFIVDYFFEESQKMRLELYDVDSASSKLTAHDFLGRLECTLGEIVGSPGNKLDRNLTGLSGKAGRITVRAEELASCKELATIQFSGTKLDKKDFLGKSDPFLVISRSNADGSFTVVHKTEVIKNNLNPQWRPFHMKVRLLCHGDHDKPIKFDCYDWDSDGGSHDFIGAFTTTMRELQDTSKRYDLINPKKKAKKKSYKNSGVINVLQCKIEQDHTFLDFIQGGMEINFTVAVDFTASNGDPRTPQSLHYNNPYAPNQYSSALRAVGDIIQDYDTDKMFPALGFGAKLQNGQVSHEFFLNGHPDTPFCQGIEGVMAAYQYTLGSVQLWGPTNFSPVINHVAKFASAYPEGTHYFVLLILTDGVITDMPGTKEAIVKASSLPMSIIIIGVGDAEFDAMEELDADNHRLSAYGKYAERDIVQFVPFREFVGGRYGKDLEMSKAYLAKEVLAEVPDQVTAYMKKRGIKPRPPQAAPVAGPGAQAGVAPPSAGQAPPPTSQAGAPPKRPPVPTRTVPAGQAPPPSGQGQPYPGQAPSGQVPYPGQAPAGGQAPPHGGSFHGAPGQQPYPGQAPSAAGQAPYPGQAPPPGGQAPYPGQAPPPGGQAPYPSQAAPPGGQAPYPGQAPPQGGQAPYPSQAPPPGGQAPYPGQAPPPGGQAPYPGQAPPYGGQAPQSGSFHGNPQGGYGAPPSGQAPYPGAPPPQYPAAGQTQYPNAQPSYPAGQRR